MILKNGYVVNKDFKLKKLDIGIQNEVISDIKESLSGNDELDLNGNYILPGFIDTHIHGAYGVRISDYNPELEKISLFEATQGVTSIAITTASSLLHELYKQLEIALQASKSVTGAKIAAIHMEGPFISKTFKGAMNADCIIDSDIALFDKFLEKSGSLLKIITVAPENENMVKFVEYAAQKGVTVSMGHTNATYEEANKIIKAGANQLTHTFNAMRALNHREPGVLGACFTNPDIVCEVICDFVHLHPSIVKLIYDIKGPDRINVISDSGHAAGLDVKEFVVDGIKRYVSDGVVRLADGTIAGSTKTVLDGVKNLVSLGIPIEDISKMTSYNPAKTLKIDKITGSIKQGNLADIVVLDSDYNVLYTFVNGKLVYKR